MKIFGENNLKMCGGVWGERPSDDFSPQTRYNHFLKMPW